MHGFFILISGDINLHIFNFLFLFSFVFCSRICLIKIKLTKKKYQTGAL